MELHKKQGQVTVIIDVSFSEDTNTIKEFILNEQCPFIKSQAGDGLLKFEWFFEDAGNKGTLLEVFENPNAWEELADKVIGTPVNLRFGELCTVEKMTVLGGITEKTREKINAMGPLIKSYVGGIN